MGRFDIERKEMVALLREKGILDSRVLAAMEKVERHLFVPPAFSSRSYEDSALPLANGQTISQPYTVAFMTESLRLVGGEKVLEIGTGSGYQAAVLAELGARVYTIERDHELLAGARKILDRLAYRIASKGGDGTVGWNDAAPFDCIIVTAGAPDIPRPLMAQLADGGRLIVPVGGRDIQSLAIVTRTGETYNRRQVDGFKFVPLIGKEGW